jgi:hypothetical protein
MGYSPLRAPRLEGMWHMRILALLALVLLVGCTRQDAATEKTNDPATGNENEVRRQLSEQDAVDATPGSGRLDQGGGLTTREGTNSVLWTNATTGQTTQGPAAGQIPR